MSNSNVLTWLIEKNCFVRAGVKSLLERSRYQPLVELSTIQGLDRVTGHEQCGLVIMGANMPPEKIALSVKSLKSQLRNAKIVLLTERLDRSSVVVAFSSGADGYVLQNISTEAFLMSLGLIMMNEKVFPTSMASMLCEYWPVPSVNDNVMLADGRDLSKREIDIVKHLANGESNKQIARRLDIAESTVKVHLKAILRKLELENRTQAAIWAFSSGLIQSRRPGYSSDAVTP